MWPLIFRNIVEVWIRSHHQQVPGFYIDLIVIGRYPKYLFGGIDFFSIFGNGYDTVLPDDGAGILYIHKIFIYFIYQPWGISNPL